MPTELKGLPGLNKISDDERRAFLLTNAEKLKKYEDDPEVFNQAANMLYDNQMFKQTFGEDAVKKAKAAGYTHDQRNELLREKIVNDAFINAYEPETVNGKLNKDSGAGEEWESIQGLSTDAKEELLRSEWKTPAQRRKEQKERDSWYEKAIDFVAGEAIQQYKRESNQKILDRIKNDDADSAASRQASVVSQKYSMPEVVGATEEETKEKFTNAITPSRFNRGIPEYASRWGDGTDVSSEMENFTIDEMRQVLAKKAAYEQTMSPDMAFTALNNEAKRYITAHQGSLKRFGLFVKDVGISALSYTADKINGIYNLALAAEDWMGEKPKVYVDNSGNVIDPKRVLKDQQGNLYYEDDEKQKQGLHVEEVDRRTLHNMGKNEDGSDADEGLFSLNPVYWTRAEQFGTLDSDEQKQYEKIGSSPYKVSYNPNEDSDLVYESFKMMSFGLADAASMLIPFGVGLGGRVLSTASKVGKVGRGLGKALDTTGRYLSAQTKVGQVAQGLAGAGGIAYAYQRGAFQETLQQNLANAEEANLNRSKQELFDLYNNNEQFRAQADAMVQQEAAKMKQEYLAQMAQEGNAQVLDEEALDKVLLDRAQNKVHNELLSQRVEQNKNSDEYAALQQEAIQSAGDAAWTSFWPEAIKYGLVNTVGYRKFLYTNPTGLKKSVSKAMKGLNEVKTEAGKARLNVTPEVKTPWYIPKKAGKYWNSNAGKFGRVAVNQFWGGAWTNGTDDMMVDAAERINEDSYRRYLDAYENGEALADEYSLIDGIYSYWKGLNNSLGQETTRNAATVGGFGSIVSASPNMANIAHLATKEGREAYKNNYQKRMVYETDANGYKTIKKDEQGNPVMEDISAKDNWREKASFFIQNGVLNTYYGAKQNERDLQNHADYVNGILDRYDDFNALKNLIASDIENENAKSLSKKDVGTARFLQAFESISALEALKKDKNDALKFSSVLDNAYALIDGASKLGTDESNMSEKQVADLLTEYREHNPTETDDQVALSNIAKNAQKMMEAHKAYIDTYDQISKYEKDNGITIAPTVKGKMMLQRALVGHWEDRIQSMKDEIGDVSNTTSKPEGEALIATYGGITNAKKRVSQYENGMYDMTPSGERVLNKLGESQLEVLLSGANAKVSRRLEDYNKAQQELRNAENSEAAYKAEQEVKNAKIAYEEALANREFRQDQLASIQEEKKRLQDAIDAHQTRQNKVLTADEIMALDPVSRARMLDEDERAHYKNDQVREIGKLLKDLNFRDKSGDAAKKIQDIATLTVNIAQAKDAYNRMANNPDAAALQMEKQTVQEAEAAYNLINQRNAQTLANSVQNITDALKVNRVKKSDREDMAFRMLRRYSNDLLNTIEQQDMLPEYKTQVDRAKEWSRVLTDIDAVVNNLDEASEWKQEVGGQIDAVIDSASNRDEIMEHLESVVEGNSALGKPEDFVKVLKGLAQLGYQKAATVVEAREKRKAREEETSKTKEEDSAKAQDAAQKAMDEAAKLKVDPLNDEKDKAMTATPPVDVPAESQVEALHKTDKMGPHLPVDRDDIELEDNGPDYKGGKAFYEKVMTSKEAADAKLNAVFATIEGKAEKGEVTVEEALVYAKKWAPDANEVDVRNALNYIIDKKAPKNSVIRQKAQEKAEAEIGFHPGDIIKDDKGREYTVQGYGWTGIEGDNKDMFVSSTIAGEPVIITKSKDGTIVRDSAGDFYSNWQLRRIQSWTKVGSSKEVTKPAAESPLDILLGWAEGRIEGKGALSQLDGTEYVKHTKGNKALGTTDGVHFSNKVEIDLGKYLTSKYPFLKVEGVSVATGVSTFGGNMGLTVVKDAEGNEHGTPSNFIRSLAKGGKAAEVVRKGLEAASKGSEAKGITPALLMEEDAESGSIEYGEMWTSGNAPEKGVLTVTRGKVGKSEVITFDVNGNGITVEATPEEYSMTDAAKEKLGDAEIPADSPFNVKSIENIDGDWYFDGTFAGNNETVTVKMTDKFDIDKALDRQKEVNEAIAIVKGVDVANPNVVDKGDYVAASSSTVEQQAESTDDVLELDNPNEVDDTNEQGEQQNEHGSFTLSATALPKYEKAGLRQRKLIPRVGSKPNDGRNHFNAWLEAPETPGGETNLQNIIDAEVPELYKRNPHMKVKFMRMKPEALGTKVGDTTVTTSNNIGRHIFLVTDYDSTAQSVHKEVNGGVITANGKKYLMIGTMGYGGLNTGNAEWDANNLQRQKLWNVIVDQLKDPDLGISLKNNEYYKTHPEETCLVLDGVSTEIVPNSLTPGDIVKQLEGQENVEHRRLSEVLKEHNQREGTSLTFQDLKWGIQEYSQFLPVKAEKNDVMNPHDVDRNAGAAFVLVPAGNGKFIPVHLDARKYNDMRPGDIADRVENLIGTNGLLAPTYTARYNAFLKLLEIFYLKSDKKTILVGKDGTRHANQVSLTDDKGNVVYTADLSGTNVDVDAFKEAFRSKFNPRINITASGLRNLQRLIELDEVGALDTDVVMLHSAGVSYSIYPVDINGQMIIPENVQNNVRVSSGKSDFREDNVQVWYSGLPYTYVAQEGSYKYGDAVVTEASDAKLFESLEFNRKIILGELSDNYSSGGYKYYVMREGEHPVVVRQDARNLLTQLSEKEALKILDKIQKEQDEKKREEEAQRALEELLEDSEKKKEEEGEGSVKSVVDPNTGLISINPAELELGLPIDNLDEAPTPEKKEGTGVPEKAETPPSSVVDNNKVDPVSKPEVKAETQSFEAILKKRKFKTELYTRFGAKWPQLEIDLTSTPPRLPSNETLRQFLAEKGMILDGIGTSEADIKAWMDTIEKCRD